MIGSAAALIVALASFNYVVDPLQVFHRPWFYEARYTTDPRLGNVGLIESQPFDTVFMGTSYSIAIRQSEIDEALGGKSLKLAISGGTSKEQLLTLSAALRKRPRRIVWQMDDYMFRDSPSVDTHLNADLYDRKFRGFYDYTVNLNTGRESLWIVLGLWKPTRRLGFRLNEIGYLKFDRSDPAELNTFPQGMDLSGQFNRATTETAFSTLLAAPSLITKGFSDGMAVNFDRDGIEFIKANPDVAFVVYFPPSSILSHVAMQIASPGTSDMLYRFNAYQLDRLSRLPNVAVFDFRNVAEITHDLDNYRDTIHYRPHVNKKLLGFIAAGEHKVSRSKPSAAIDDLRTHVRDYIEAMTHAPPPDASIAH